MIDSHCHLTYDQLSSHLDDVLARAAAAGVDRIITIGTSLPDCQKAIDLCRTHPNIRCAIGIHPHHAAEAADSDLDLLRDLQQQPQVLALGEMGLDYHHDFSPRPRQREIFLRQLDLARQTQKPIVIHCRQAIDDCLAILHDFPNIPAVFHCFTGSLAEAKRILDRGYLLGFTGIVTYKKSDDLREVVKRTPLDRLLLETDAPYLAPEPQRRRKFNEPSLLPHTAATIAKLKGLPQKDLAHQTATNTTQFFRWPDDK